MWGKDDLAYDEDGRQDDRERGRDGQNCLLLLRIQLCIQTGGEDVSMRGRDGQNCLLLLRVQLWI